ncbi:MAG: Mu transposase C-terminal domain-containing protein [Solirubrobacteraceae bacterium]
MDRRTEEALARYLAVAGHLRRRRGDCGPSIGALSAEPIPWVGDTYRRRSQATLYRYLKAAREQRLAGLYRQERSDKGQRTAITAELFALCCAVREKFPRMGSQQIIDTLVAEEVAGAESIVASTLRRWLREQHLPRSSAKKADAGKQAFVRWECSAPGELWLADATPGVFLPNPQRPGKFRATQLLLIEDGYSRRLVGGGFYWNQQLPALDDCFYRATLAWGIPGQFYVDRGNIFVSKHLRRVCAELGVQLIHAQTAPAKGKIERVIQTVQDATFAQLRDLVERGEITDVVALNAALWTWLDGAYHQREHSETGAAPAARMPQPVNPVADVLAHEQTFLWQASREVRRAGCTIELFGNTYEVGDRSLAGLRVQVRFNPYRLQTVAIWHEGRFRQTVTAGALKRERHPHVSPLPERGPLTPLTTLNQISALVRRAQNHLPQHPVAFAAGTDAPPRLAEVLAGVLGRALAPRELQAVRRHWQRYGPFDPQGWLPTLERFVAQKGRDHHISVYLDLCRTEGGFQ